MGLDTVDQLINTIIHHGVFPFMHQIQLCTSTPRFGEYVTCTTISYESPVSKSLVKLLLGKLQIGHRHLLRIESFNCLRLQYGTPWLRTWFFPVFYEPFLTRITILPRLAKPASDLECMVVSTREQCMELHFHARICDKCLSEIGIRLKISIPLINTFSQMTLLIFGFECYVCPWVNAVFR